MADLVRYANAQHIEVIPEIPTFTHSYYLLTRHKELGAISGAEWPDIYDPTKPEVYKLVFDVFDEYIEVMKPKIVHIGHDEMFYPGRAVHSLPQQGSLRIVGRRTSARYTIIWRPRGSGPRFTATT